MKINMKPVCNMKKLLILVLHFFVLNCSAQNTKTMKEILSPYHSVTNFIQLKEGDIAYTKEGTGNKTLVFVHGLSSNADAWYRNIEELKKNYTCIAIDLPGYGKSYKNAEAFTPTYFAEVIKEFSEKLKLKKFTLIGHSMGGQASIRFATKYPEKLEKLILVAPAGIEEFSEFEGNAMKSVMKQKTIMATSEDQIQRNYQLNFFKMPKEAEHMIEERKKITQTSDFDLHALAIEKSIAGMLDDVVITDLPKVKTPALLLFAKNDMLIPNKYLHPLMTLENVAEKAQKSLNGSKLIIMDEVGHFIQFEKPAEVNREIEAFMRGK